MRPFRLSALVSCLWAVHAWAEPGQPPPFAEPAPAAPLSAPLRVDQGTVLRSDRPVASVRLAIREGRFEAALGAVDALLARVPHDDELRLTRVRLLYWLGRFDLAQADLRPLLERHPGDMDAMELQGQIELALEHPERALQVYQALEAAGDTRMATHQRVLDLELELDKVSDVLASLRLGGTLSDEQRLRLDTIQHPVYVDAVSLTTLHSGTTWKRFEANASYRFSRRWTVLAGAGYEMRPDESAWVAKVEGYGNIGPVSAMLHLSGSPSNTFLARYDLRGDASVQILRKLAVGLYGRYAHYPYVDLGMIGPNLSLSLGAWTLTPGYVASLVRPGNPVNHTGYLKIRWQPTAPSALLLWTYVGQDPAFTERFRPDVTASYGMTVLFGVDHWWTGRFGTRVSISHTQPFANTDPYTEFALVLRGRL